MNPEDKFEAGKDEIPPARPTVPTDYQKKLVSNLQKESAVMRGYSAGPGIFDEINRLGSYVYNANSTGVNTNVPIVTDPLRNMMRDYDQQRRMQGMSAHLAREILTNLRTELDQDARIRDNGRSMILVGESDAENMMHLLEVELGIQPGASFEVKRGENKPLSMRQLHNLIGEVAYKFQAMGGGSTRYAQYIPPGVNKNVALSVIHALDELGMLP